MANSVTHKLSAASAATYTMHATATASAQPKTTTLSGSTNKCQAAALAALQMQQDRKIRAEQEATINEEKEKYVHTLLDLTPPNYKEAAFFVSSFNNTSLKEKRCQTRLLKLILDKFCAKLKWTELALTGKDTLTQKKEKHFDYKQRFNQMIDHQITEAFKLHKLSATHSIDHKSIITLLETAEGLLLCLPLEVSLTPIHLDQFSKIAQVYALLVPYSINHFYACQRITNYITPCFINEALTDEERKYLYIFGAHIYQILEFLLPLEIHNKTFLHQLNGHQKFCLEVFFAHTLKKLNDEIQTKEIPDDLQARQKKFENAVVATVEMTFDVLSYNQMTTNIFTALCRLKTPFWMFELIAKTFPAKYITKNLIQSIDECFKQELQHFKKESINNLILNKFKVIKTIIDKVQAVNPKLAQELSLIYLQSYLPSHIPLSTASTTKSTSQASPFTTASASGSGSGSATAKGAPAK